MISFLYTGAEKFLHLQPSQAKSLGGYISSSLIPNDDIGALFGSASSQQVLAGQSSVRCIALHNTSTSPIDGAKIYYTTEGSDCSFRIGLSVPGMDSCGYYAQKLTTDKSKPHSVIFIDAKGEDSAIPLPSIPVDRYMIVWIERTLNSNKLNKDMSCDILHQKFESQDSYTISEVTVIGDTGDILHNKSILLDVMKGRFQIIFNSNHTDPLIFDQDREPIIISYNHTKTSTELAQLIFNKLQSILTSRGIADISISNDKITITDTEYGSATGILANDSGMQVVILNQGSSKQSQTKQDVQLVVETA